MMINKPPRPNAVHADIVTYYADRIDDGKIRVGEQLPGIHATARKFKMSPASAAKAFTQLQVLGYVESDGRGTFVLAAGPMRLYKLLQRVLNDLQEAGESLVPYAGDSLRPPRIIGKSGTVECELTYVGNVLKGLWAAREVS